MPKDRTATWGGSPLLLSLRFGAEMANNFKGVGREIFCEKSKTIQMSAFPQNFFSNLSEIQCLKVR
jgi:hypothetical protein